MWYWWVCWVSLHQASWKQFSTLTTTEQLLIDMDTMGQVDPKQILTPSVRTSSLPLLFSIWMTKVKPIPLPQLHTCRSCPFAPRLQQCSAPVSQALEHLRIHRTDHPRIPKQPSCALYLLFLITFVVWNNKAVYKELQHIKDNRAGLWLSCVFWGVVSSAFAWWQRGRGGN